MSLRSYRELKAWQSAMNLAEQCYVLTKRLPKDELYGLTSQIRRAAVSVPANIAEGQGRQHSREFLQFLAIARGSLLEVETHLQLCQRVGLLTEEDIAPALATADELGRILTGLRRAIEAKL